MLLTDDRKVIEVLPGRSDDQGRWCGELWRELEVPVKINYILYSTDFVFRNHQDPGRRVVLHHPLLVGE